MTAAAQVLYLVGWIFLWFLFGGFFCTTIQAGTVLNTSCTTSLLLRRNKSSLFVNEKVTRLQKGEFGCSMDILLQITTFCTPFPALSFQIYLCTFFHFSVSGGCLRDSFVFSLDTVIIVSLSTGFEVTLSSIDF